MVHRLTSAGPHAGRRRAPRGAIAGVAALVLVFATALAAGGQEVSAQSGNDGVIHVFTAGDRAADGSLAGLQGATMQLYRDSDLSNPVAGKSCVTDANGNCDITSISWSGTSEDFWVAETGVPGGFAGIGQITTSGDGTHAYAASTTLSDGDHDQSVTFDNRRNNPAFPSACGVSVALIFDRSGSIDSGEQATMKAAGKGFAEALVNTPSSISVYSFSDGATQELGTTSTETASGVTTIKNAIDGITSGNGLTNWDGAFRAIPANDDDARVVIMLTDGDPTRTVDESTGGDTDQIDIEAGVASANLVKSRGANGATVLAVGVAADPNDVSDVNLQSISGPAIDVDYFKGDFSALTSTLDAIATNLCGAKVTITKNVDGSSASGWEFTPTTNRQGVSFNPNPGVTGGNGSAVITVNGIPEGGASATFTESFAGHANAFFVSATCSKQAVGVNGAITFTVQRGDDITCTFDNSTLAPCTVSSTDITCNPSNTDSSSPVSTPVAAVAAEVVTQPAPIAATLASTGSGTFPLAAAGLGMVLVGLAFVMLRPRRVT